MGFGCNKSCTQNKILNKQFKCDFFGIGHANGNYVLEDETNEQQILWNFLKGGRMCFLTPIIFGGRTI